MRVVRERELIESEFHLFEQGQCIFAANECCVVCLERETQKLNVAFFTFRWHQRDEEMASTQAELLRRRLKGALKKRSAIEMLTEAADECLVAYLKAEGSGWMRQIFPMWKHYCDDCIFLGPLIEGDKQSGFGPGVNEYDISFSKAKPLSVDLYYCPEEKPLPSVLARFSSRPDGYHSGLLMGMAGYHDRLNAAYKRAKELNLLRGLSLPRLNLLDCGNGTDMGDVKIPVTVVVDE